MRSDPLLAPLLDYGLFVAYRVSGYALTYLMDDAAILAMMFC